MVSLEDKCRDALRLAQAQGSTRLAEALSDVLVSIAAEQQNRQTKVGSQPKRNDHARVTFR